MRISIAAWCMEGSQVLTLAGAPAHVHVTFQNLCFVDTIAGRTLSKLLVYCMLQCSCCLWQWLQAYVDWSFVWHQTISIKKEPADGTARGDQS